MILDFVYINKNLYASNQVRFRLIYSLSGLNNIDLYTRDFCYLYNTLTNKTNIYIKEKS